MLSSMVVAWLWYEEVVKTANLDGLDSQAKPSKPSLQKHHASRNTTMSASRGVSWIERHGMGRYCCLLKVCNDYLVLCTKSDQGSCIEE
jgi:hypothetical protein